jgi:YVTN family beta-propeller protein
MRTHARAAALPALAVWIVAVMPLVVATSGGGHEPVAAALGARRLAFGVRLGPWVPGRTPKSERRTPQEGAHKPCASSRQHRPTQTSVHGPRSGCDTPPKAGHLRGAGHRHASPANVYAATRSGKLRPSVAHLPARVYVPNSEDGTIDVINPATFRVVKRFRVGLIPHHITPSWDLRRLYVDDEGSSSLTVIDPRKGRPIRTIRVPFPYNLYFTPDGRKAIVAVERLDRLDFRNPHTWRLLKSVTIPWPGVDHLDFSADGRYLLASTEYSGVVVKIDTVTMKLTGHLNVGGLPIDVRLAPDGSVFYVANQGRDGVSMINPVAMKEVGFLPTGAGAHGLAVSRDTKSLYVSNRLAGTISVISFRTHRVMATWLVGGNPDMLQVSPDGRQLWVSNRFDGTVSVVDTRTGRLLHTIPVGLSPHGLCYFPNAGRVSLGHNGLYR